MLITVQQTVHLSILSDILAKHSWFYKKTHSDGQVSGE